MITLKDYMEAVQHRITDSTEYQWSCYGPNARTMEYWNGRYQDGVSVNIVFDTKTQFVYEMEAWDYANDRQYRWIHPGYIESHVKESQERDIDWMVSIDNCRFINLELPQDILKKATAIAAEEEYDDRIMIQLTLSDPQQIMLMEMAHEADMSLNQFVEKILREKMARHGIEI
jgi:hypothetical protein